MTVGYITRQPICADGIFPRIEYENPLKMLYEGHFGSIET